MSNNKNLEFYTYIQTIHVYTYIYRYDMIRNAQVEMCIYKYIYIYRYIAHFPCIGLNGSIDLPISLRRLRNMINLTFDYTI